MDELITISDQRTVSARELYEKLGFDKSNWAKWHKINIKNNRFAIQGQDYEGFVVNTNGNQTQDYQLSIDFAKRLCMMARTEKGEQIRNYFIEVEKRYQRRKDNMPLLKRLADKFMDALARKVAKRLTEDLRFSLIDLQYESARLAHSAQQIYDAIHPSQPMVKN